MQTVEKTRNTLETQISLTLNPRGDGNREIQTPIKFFNHMLELFCSHGNFDIKLCANSLDNDSHHLVEDTAITLGEAFREALGDKKGIKRYASVILPMDEALVLCSLDISGRAFCKCDVNIKEEKTSDFETVLLYHFFNSFAASAQLTLHIKMLDGTDPHHIIECAFKACARALREAVSTDFQNADKIPSTKGML